MSFSKIFSAQATLLGAEQIDIETDISRGLHNFTIVGLGDKAVNEARDRVAAAIKNSGFTSPKQRNQKVVVSLAPAHIRKNGARFDVAIALSYLAATGDIEFNPASMLFFGELALDGSIRPIHGVLPLARFAKQNGFTQIFVPKENAREAAIISDVQVYPIESLQQVVAHIHTPRAKIGSAFPLQKISPQPPTAITHIGTEKDRIDMSDIKGQESAKRALMIAAAGRHNIALVGPPGTGKTMLAKAFQGILPPLLFEEILDVTSIHSVAHTLHEPVITTPPLRAPHHTASYASLFGGGAHARPGEITLAHRGVLFADEFAEFEKRIIEGLRQPLEDKTITISRVDGSVQYPADFILLATQNPCPCGFYGTDIKPCMCNMQQVERYRQKISGPIIDRIDLWVHVPHIEHTKILERQGKASESEKMRESIQAARAVQSARFTNASIRTNGEMGPRDIERYIALGPETKALILSATKRLKLSVRACHKVMKVARTIADIEHKKELDEASILEALQYRLKD